MWGSIRIRQRMKKLTMFLALGFPTKKAIRENFLSLSAIGIVSSEDFKESFGILDRGMGNLFKR